MSGKVPGKGDARIRPLFVFPLNHATLINFQQFSITSDFVVCHIVELSQFEQIGSTTSSLLA